MVDKRTSRACAPPIEPRNPSSVVVNGRVDSMTRSAPTNVRAWSSIDCERLWRNEPMATSAATPTVIESEKSRRRIRLVRLSRHAILSMKLGAILNHFTVPQPDRFLCETRDLWVVRHQHERRSGVGIQFEHNVNHRPACLRVQISRGLVGE